MTSAYIFSIISATIPNQRKNNSDKRGVYGNTYGGSYGYATNAITYLPPKIPDRDKPEDKYVGDIGTRYKTSFGYENTRVPLHKIDDFHKHHNHRNGFNNLDKFHNHHFHDENHQFYNHDRHDHGFYDYHDHDHHNDFRHHQHHCFIRARAGFKIGRNTIRKSCLTLDLKSCEDSCKHEGEFNCQTFAYR